MNLQTPVHIDRPPFAISHKEVIMSLGSCFATESCLRLRRDGFRVYDGPCGTLYNPASIAKAFQLMLDETRLTDKDLVQHGGLYHSMWHHGQYSRLTEEDTLNGCNEAIQIARSALRKADTLILTFGTAWIYEYKGQVVANCHKLPASNFTRRRLTVSEIVRTITTLLTHPELCEKHVIFTVSPIRHKTDGLHENQLSKSTLLLAIDEIVKSQPEKYYYFPSYELLMDELRDYRFYTEDMCHPTPQAVDYVYERFADTFFTPTTREAALAAKRYHQECEHQPLHLSQEGIAERNKMLEQKRNQLLQQYTTLSI